MIDFILSILLASLMTCQRVINPAGMGHARKHEIAPACCQAIMPASQLEILLALTQASMLSMKHDYRRGK